MSSIYPTMVCGACLRTDGLQHGHAPTWQILAISELEERGVTGECEEVEGKDRAGVGAEDTEGAVLGSSRHVGLSVLFSRNGLEMGVDGACTYVQCPQVREDFGEMMYWGITGVESSSWTRLW